MEAEERTEGTHTAVEVTQARKAAEEERVGKLNARVQVTLRAIVQAYIISPLPRQAVGLDQTRRKRKIPKERQLGPL